MGWTNVAAGLGTQATISALEAAKGQVSKRQYKRLISTAVAQLLELHPDIGKGKARKRAWRITGAKPSKKVMRAKNNLGWKEGAEGAVAAAATAGVAKVAGIVGDKLQEKFGAGDDDGRKPEEYAGATEESASTDGVTQEPSEGR